MMKVHDKWNLAKSTLIISDTCLNTRMAISIGETRLGVLRLKARRLAAVRHTATYQLRLTESRIKRTGLSGSTTSARPKSLSTTLTATGQITRSITCDCATDLKTPTTESVASATRRASKGSAFDQTTVDTKLGLRYATSGSYWEAMTTWSLLS